MDLRGHIVRHHALTQVCQNNCRRPVVLPSRPLLSSAGLSLTTSRRARTMLPQSRKQLPACGPPRCKRKAKFNRKKLLLAAIETIQQGSASAEDAAALADVVAEFNVAEQKRKRRRVLDEARRARAFQKREAAPSNR